MASLLRWAAPRSASPTSLCAPASSKPFLGSPRGLGGFRRHMLPLTRVPSHHHHGRVLCLLITNRQNVQMAPPILRWPRKGDHRFPPHLSPCISGHLCGPDPMLCAIPGGALQTLTREKLAGPRSLPSAPEPSFPFIVCCSRRQADALDDSHRAETRRLSCKPSVALNWLRPRLPVLQAERQGVCSALVWGFVADVLCFETGSHCTAALIWDWQSPASAPVSGLSGSGSGRARPRARGML